MSFWELIIFIIFSFRRFTFNWQCCHNICTPKKYSVFSMLHLSTISQHLNSMIKCCVWNARKVLWEERSLSRCFVFFGRTGGLQSMTGPSHLKMVLNLFCSLVYANHHFLTAHNHSQTAYSTSAICTTINICFSCFTKITPCLTSVCDPLFL